jgi:hypothetical protein
LRGHFRDIHIQSYIKLPYPVVFYLLTLCANTSPPPLHLSIIYTKMADPSTSPPLTRASVQAAHELIKPYVHRTPVLTNTTINNLASTPRSDLAGTRWEAKEGGASSAPANPRLRLWFKCENFQKIGAFKARGAFHAIERLKKEPGWEEGGGRERGVVTHSSGEFGFPLFVQEAFLFQVNLEVGNSQLTVMRTILDSVMGYPESRQW